METNLDNKITGSPEQRLRTVATLLKGNTEFRRHNGKNKPHSYVGTVDTLASQGSHLADLVLAYLDGDLKPIPVRDTPF